MRKTRQLALICAGPANSQALAQLPGIEDRLGPVKATSFRLASRITNALRSGFPARTIEDLAGCGIILVVAPDRGVKRVVDELVRSKIPWPGKMVVLLSAALDSSELKVLAERGAGVASLHNVEGMAGPRYLAEGTTSVLRELRSILPIGSQMMEMEPGKKQLCLAGLSLVTTMLTPMIDSAVNCLKIGGLSGRECSALVDRLVTNTARAYVKSGPKSWGGALADRDWSAISKQMSAISARDPELAKWFDQCANYAVRRMYGETDSTSRTHVKAAS
jgi:predicted short-subunit dehydrogenase-like oxidoreductase (DUF2520 family)